MICPSCNKQATSFFRHSFTTQGVSMFKSMKGYLTCHHCGVLLKVTMFKIQLWVFLLTAVTILMLFVFNYRSYVPVFGFDNMAAIWISIVVGLFCIFTFGMWKYSHVEKTE